MNYEIIGTFSEYYKQVKHSHLAEGCTGVIDPSELDSVNAGIAAVMTILHECHLDNDQEAEQLPEISREIIKAQKDIRDELRILNINFELLNHIKRDNDISAAKAAGSRSGRETPSC